MLGCERCERLIQETFNGILIDTQINISLRAQVPNIRVLGAKSHWDCSIWDLKVPCCWSLGPLGWLLKKREGWLRIQVQSISEFCERLQFSRLVLQSFYRGLGLRISGEGLGCQMSWTQGLRDVWGQGLA